MTNSDKYIAPKPWYVKSSDGSADRASGRRTKKAKINSALNKNLISSHSISSHSSSPDDRARTSAGSDKDDDYLFYSPSNFEQFRRRDFKIAATLSHPREKHATTVYSAALKKPVYIDDELVLLFALKAIPLNLRFDVEDQYAGGLFESHARVTGHPNIAKLYGSFRFLKRFFIVLDAQRGGTVARMIREFPGYMKTNVVVHMALQIARAITHMHEHGVVHCNLNLENVMIAERAAKCQCRATVKIVGLGSADLFEVRRPEERRIFGTRGTLPYNSPVAQKGGYRDVTKDDVYALGVMLYEMVCGMRPFDDGFGEDAEPSWKEQAAVLAAKNRPLQWKTPVWEESGDTLIGHVKELLQRMLVVDDEDRPSAEEVEEELSEMLSKSNPFWVEEE